MKASSAGTVSLVICALAFVTLAALRVEHVIDWRLRWIFAPIWGPFLIVFVLLVLGRFGLLPKWLRDAL